MPSNVVHVHLIPHARRRSRCSGTTASWVRPSRARWRRRRIASSAAQYRTSCTCSAARTLTGAHRPWRRQRRRPCRACRRRRCPLRLRPLCSAACPSGRSHRCWTSSSGRTACSRAQSSSRCPRRRRGTSLRSSPRTSPRRCTCTTRSCARSSWTRSPCSCRSRETRGGTLRRRIGRRPSTPCSPATPSRPRRCCRRSCRGTSCAARRVRTRVRDVECTATRDAGPPAAPHA